MKDIEATVAQKRTSSTSKFKRKFFSLFQIFWDNFCPRGSVSGLSKSTRIRIHNTKKEFFFSPYLLAARAAASDAESQKERIRKRRESGRSSRWVEP
jgi:hypothetical protein